MTNYYHRYWQKKLKSKSQGSPPIWTQANFNYHFDFAKPYFGSKILDIGAGDGTFDNYLQSKINSNVISLEPTLQAIKQGQKLYPNNKFINSSAEKLPFSANSFNTALLIEVIEHLIDTDIALSEIYRILKPKGYLFITTTDFNFLKKVLLAAFAWDKYFYPNNPHIRFFTRQTLTEICSTHHFKLIKYQWNGSYFHLMPKGQMAIFQKC